MSHRTMTNREILAHANAVRDSNDRLERGVRLSLLLAAWAKDRVELAGLKKEKRKWQRRSAQ